MSASSNISGNPLHSTFSHPCKGDVEISAVKANKKDHYTVRVEIHLAQPGFQFPQIFGKKPTPTPKPFTHFLEHIPGDYVERLKPQLQKQIHNILQNHKSLESAIQSIEKKLSGYKQLKPKRTDNSIPPPPPAPASPVIEIPVPAFTPREDIEINTNTPSETATPATTYNEDDTPVQGDDHTIADDKTDIDTENDSTATDYEDTAKTDNDTAKIETPESDDPYKVDEIDETTDPVENRASISTGDSLELHQEIQSLKTQTEKLLLQIDIQKDRFQWHLKLVNALNKVKSTALTALSGSNAPIAAEAPSIEQLKAELDNLRQLNKTLTQRIEEFSAIGDKEQELDQRVETLINKLQAASFSSNVLEAIYNWQDQFKASVTSESDIVRHQKTFDDLIAIKIYKMCKDEVDATFDKHKPKTSLQSRIAGLDSQAHALINLVRQEREQAWKELEKTPLTDDNVLDAVIDRKLKIACAIQTDAALIEMLSHQYKPGTVATIARLSLAAAAVLGTGLALYNGRAQIQAAPGVAGKSISTAVDFASTNLQAVVGGAAGFLHFSVDGAAWGLQQVVNSGTWTVKKLLYDLPTWGFRKFRLDTISIGYDVIAHYPNKLTDFVTKDLINKFIIGGSALIINKPVDLATYLINDIGINYGAKLIGTIADPGFQKTADFTASCAKNVLSRAEWLVSSTGIKNPDVVRAIAITALSLLISAPLAYRFRGLIARKIYPIGRNDNYGMCADYILSNIKKTAQKLIAGNNLAADHQLLSLSKNKALTVEELHKLVAHLTATCRGEHAQAAQNSDLTLKLCEELEALDKSLDIIAECRNQHRKNILEPSGKELKKLTLQSSHPSIPLIWNGMVQSALWNGSTSLGEMVSEEKQWAATFKNKQHVHASIMNLTKSQASFQKSVEDAEALIAANQDQDPILNKKIILQIKNSIDVSKLKKGGQSCTTQEIDAYKSNVEEARKQMDSLVQESNRRLNMRNVIFQEINQGLEQVEANKTILSQLEKDNNVNLQSSHHELDILKNKLADLKKFAFSTSAQKTKLQNFDIPQLQEHHKGVKKVLKNCSDFFKAITDAKTNSLHLKSTRENVLKRIAELKAEGLLEDAAILDKKTSSLMNKYGSDIGIATLLPPTPNPRAASNLVKIDANKLDSILSTFDKEQKILKTLRKRIHNEVDVLLGELKKAREQVKEIEDSYNNSLIRNCYFDTFLPLGGLWNSFTHYFSHKIISNPLKNWLNFGLKQQIDAQCQTIEELKKSIIFRSNWSILATTYQFDKLNAAELQDYYKVVIDKISETRLSLEQARISEAYQKHEEFQSLRKKAQEKIQALLDAKPPQILLAKGIQSKLDEVGKKYIFTLSSLAGSNFVNRRIQLTLSNLSADVSILKKLYLLSTDLIYGRDNASKLTSALKSSNQPHINAVRQLKTRKYHIPKWINPHVIAGEDADRLRKLVLEETQKQIEKSLKDLSEVSDQLNNVISTFVDKDSTWFKSMEKEVVKAKNRVSTYESQLPSKWLTWPSKFNLIGTDLHDLAPDYLELYETTVNKVTEDAAKELEGNTAINSVAKEYKVLATLLTNAKLMVETLQKQGHLHSAREIEFLSNKTQKQLEDYQITSNVGSRHKVSSLPEMTQLKNFLISRNKELYNLMHRKKRDFKETPLPAYLQLDGQQKLFGEELRSDLGKEIRKMVIEEASETLTKCINALNKRQQLMDKLGETLHRDWKGRLTESIKTHHRKLEPSISIFEVDRPDLLTWWDKLRGIRLQDKPTMRSTVNLENLRRGELVLYAKKVIGDASTKAADGKPNPNDPIAALDKAADLKGLDAALTDYQKQVKNTEQFINTGLAKIKDEQKRTTKTENLRILLRHIEGASQLVAHALQHQADLKSAIDFLKNATTAMQFLTKLKPDESVTLGPWGTMASLEAANPLLTRSITYHADKDEAAELHQKARIQILNGEQATAAKREQVALEAATQAAKTVITDLPLAHIVNAVNQGVQIGAAVVNGRAVDAAYSAALGAAQHAQVDPQHKNSKGALIASVGVAAGRVAYQRLNNVAVAIRAKRAAQVAGEAAYDVFLELGYTKDEAAEAAILAAGYYRFNRRHSAGQHLNDPNLATAYGSIARNLANKFEVNIGKRPVLASTTAGLFVAMVCLIRTTLPLLPQQNINLQPDAANIDYILNQVMQAAHRLCTGTDDKTKAVAVGTAVGTAAAILENLLGGKTALSITTMAAARAAIAARISITGPLPAALALPQPPPIVVVVDPPNEATPIIAATKAAVDQAARLEEATPATIAEAAGKAAAKAAVPSIAIGPNTAGGPIRSNLRLVDIWLTQFLNISIADLNNIQDIIGNTAAWTQEINVCRTNIRDLLMGIGACSGIDDIKSRDQLLQYADESMRACNKARDLIEDSVKKINQKLGIIHGWVPLTQFPTKVKWDLIGVAVPANKAKAR